MSVRAPRFCLLPVYTPSGLYCLFCDVQRCLRTSLFQAFQLVDMDPAAAAAWQVRETLNSKPLFSDFYRFLPCLCLLALPHGRLSI